MGEMFTFAVINTGDENSIQNITSYEKKLVGFHAVEGETKITKIG